MTDASTPTPREALELLAALGAPLRLLRHHELVVEAALLLVEQMASLGAVRFDRAAVLAGAAWHDAGKIEFPAEMDEPGARHEAAGEALLLHAGVAPKLARFCRTHAQWTAEHVEVEDLLVALADKLWKGKREERLEARLCNLVAKATGVSAWEAFASFDALCEDIARTADDRLARSRV